MGVRLLILFYLASGSAHAASTCERIKENVVDTYRSLFKRIDPNALVDPSTPLLRMIRTKDGACDQARSAQGLISTAVHAVSQHSGKVGLILPLTGAHAEKGREILAGMKKAYPMGGQEFQNRFIVRDSAGLVQGLEKQLADLVFKENVGLVVGGLTTGEAVSLTNWGTKLRMTMLVLNQPVDEQVRNHIYYIFPNEKFLAQTLALQAKASGYKKIAVVRPMQASPQHFSQLFEAALKKLEIEVPHSYVFNPSDYSSLEAAAKKIFKIDPVERGEELAQLVRHAKERAKAAGLPFNPSLVALDPIVEVDAIFLADNFRTARHFAKLVKYLGVEKMALLGVPSFRAKGLVSPKEPLLEGTVFVDYIGDYRSLPSAVVIPTLGNGYFVDPDFANKADYQVIGFHAGQTAERVMRAGFIKRHLLYKELMTLSNSQSRFFLAGRTFDADHRASWPAFLFRVNGEGIQPILSPKVGLQSREIKAVAQ